MRALARELSWFFLAILLAAPIAYFFGYYLLDVKPEGPTLTKNEEIFYMELFIIGAIFGFICTYLIRVIIWAVTKYLVGE